MAQLQQQLKRLEAERDRLKEIADAANDRIPASKACEAITEHVNKNSRDDPLLPSADPAVNPWTSNKPIGGGDKDCCIVA